MIKKRANLQGSYQTIFHWSHKCNRFMRSTEDSTHFIITKISVENIYKHFKLFQHIELLGTGTGTSYLSHCETCTQWILRQSQVLLGTTRVLIHNEAFTNMILDKPFFPFVLSSGAYLEMLQTWYIERL